MSKLYFGGIPTEPDVNLLLRKYPAYEPGMSIPYEEVEQLLNVHWQTKRFGTVTRSWRRRILRMFNQDLSPRGGQFVVLHPHERINKQGGRLRSGIMIVGRSGRHLAMVPRQELSDIDIKRLDHFSRRAALLIDADRRAATPEIEAPAPMRGRF